MKLLIIQNSHLAPLGVLADCVAERGGQTKILIPSNQDALPSQSDEFNGLIILGGPMHVRDDTYAPLPAVIHLIHQFSKEQKPILGVCLGAQILARAFGKPVYPHHTFELGFTPLNLIASTASADPLLKNCPEAVHVMEWHVDTFDLPDEAVLLMTGAACKNQAFRIGESIYGFQCHLEVTPAILQNWIASNSELLGRSHPNFSDQLNQQIERYLNQSIHFCRSVGYAWLDLVETRMNVSPIAN